MRVDPWKTSGPSSTGVWFGADGDTLTDVRSKVVRTISTAVKMCNIWSSRWIPLKLKLRICKEDVCSQLVCGSEDWKLDDDTIRIVNVANSYMLHRITDKTIHEEA